MTVMFVEPNSNIINVKYSLQYDPQFIDKLQYYIRELIQQFGSYSVHLDLKGLTISGLVNQQGWMEDIIQNSGTMQYTDYLVEIRIFNAPMVAKQLYTVISRLLKNIKGKIHFETTKKNEQQPSQQPPQRISISSSS